jgi:hypothetical protein
VGLVVAGLEDRHLTTRSELRPRGVCSGEQRLERSRDARAGARQVPREVRVVRLGDVDVRPHQLVPRVTAVAGHDVNGASRDRLGSRERDALSGGALEDVEDLRPRNTEGSTCSDGPLDESSARHFTLLVTLGEWGLCHG